VLYRQKQRFKGFASARAFLGGDWPEQFPRGRRFWDALEIIDTGLALQALNGIPKFERLVAKLLRGDLASAMCELMVLVALRHMGLDPEVEPATDTDTAGPRRRGKPKRSHRGHPVPGP